MLRDCYTLHISDTGDSCGLLARDAGVTTCTYSQAEPQPVTGFILDKPLHAEQNAESNDLRRVIIVDDHPIFSQGLKTCLESHGVVVCDNDGTPNLAKGEITADQPEVVLAGVSRPKDLDARYLQNLWGQFPDARVLVIMDEVNPDEAHRLLKAGVRGCISRRKEIGDFLRAIEIVAKDEIYLDKELATWVLARYFFPSPLGGRRRAEPLSKRF